MNLFLMHFALSEEDMTAARLNGWGANKRTAAYAGLTFVSNGNAQKAVDRAMHAELYRPVLIVANVEVLDVEENALEPIYEATQSLDKPWATERELDGFCVANGKHRSSMVGDLIIVGDDSDDSFRAYVVASFGFEEVQIQRKDMALMSDLVEIARWSAPYGAPAASMPGGSAKPE